MSLNWRRNDYFQRLLDESPASHSALELLVDDLHRDKLETIWAFLDHCGSEDFLWALVRMLSAENTRVAGNSAYIFGTVAESVDGQTRVLSLINGPHSQNVLVDLTSMLDYDDDESVMNAAGTLGTLAESSGGREWMLKEPCLQVTISRVTGLLVSNNLWTASNAALVLARLSIAEEGCQLMLDHNFSHQILTKLIESLGIDEAGRGMNAAFALGRLCDLETGRIRLLQHPDSEKMISRLCSMLSSKDSGCGKNACYAISCLATSNQGHERLLGHKSSEVMLQRLGSQLSNEDSETAWFAAMTLRTLASKRVGCLSLRNHSHVVPALQIIQCKGPSHQDLKEEVELTLELLKTLHQPAPPLLQVKGHSEIQADWEEVTLKSGLEVTYRLFNDSKLLYEGKSISHLVTALRADTQYSFRLQLSTEGDESPFSDVAVATTDESSPDAPVGLRILGVTTSQLKLGWAPPEFNNGALKGYVVYNGKQQVETTTELNSIVTGLAPGMTYDLHVCAFNHKGKGPKASITATTTELGKHAPGKPSLTVRGRSEIHVTWAPPEFPRGRLHRFELTQNGKVIYSGTELNYTAHRLTPNTEYKFTVIAVTSEGKCESDAAKKKTPKDEYNVQSTAPIFFSHPVRTTEESAGKAKEKSSSRTRSRHGRKRVSSAMQRHLKQAISPTYTEPPSVRSSSRPSSGFSVDSSHSKTYPRRKMSVGVLEKRVSKSSSTVTPLTELSTEARERSSTSTSEDEDEEERWPGTVGSEYGSILDDHLSYSTSNTSHGKHRKPHNGTSKTSQRPSDAGTSSDASGLLDNTSSKGHRESKKKVSLEIEHGWPTKADEVKPHVRGHAKMNSKDLNLLNDHSSTNQRHFETCEAAVSKPSKHTMQSPKHKHLAGNLGDQESNPSAFKLDRLLRSLKSTTVRKTSLNSHRVLGPRKDSLQRTSPIVTWDPRLSSGVGFSTQLLTKDLRSDSLLPSREFTSREISTLGKEFTLLANGQIVYRDSRSGSGTSKKSSSSSEATTAKSEKLLSREKKRTRRTSHGETVLQPLHQDGLTAAEIFIADLPWEGGDGSKVNTAPPASWITQTKTALADSAIPFRSALADHPSFYQRANSIISSHRPTLKKNLAKLASYPGAFPIQSGVSAIQYEPEFPSSKPVTTNKYQFIPTQYRTQPTNLPGQAVPRRNATPSSSVHEKMYDKSAYVKKLEALSQLNAVRKAGVVCHDCGHDNDGRTTPKAVVALKYSHRNDLSVSVGGAKTRNSPATPSVPDIAS